LFIIIFGFLPATHQSLDRLLVIFPIGRVTALLSGLINGHSAAHQSRRSTPVPPEFFRRSAILAVSLRLWTSSVEGFSASSVTLTGCRITFAGFTGCTGCSIFASWTFNSSCSSSPLLKSGLPSAPGCCSPASFGHSRLAFNATRICLIRALQRHHAQGRRMMTPDNSTSGAPAVRPIADSPPESPSGLAGCRFSLNRGAGIAA
jgi:hypothetical protein